MWREATPEGDTGRAGEKGAGLSLPRRRCAVSTLGPGWVLGLCSSEVKVPTELLSLAPGGGRVLGRASF